MNIETIVKENKNLSFNDVLQLAENRMNNESQSCLGGLSANEALTHRPQYISLLWQSKKYQSVNIIEKQCSINLLNYHFIQL